MKTHRVKARCYETTEGDLFIDRNDAEAAQSLIDFRNFYEPVSIPGVEAVSVYDWLEENSKELRKTILPAIENLKSKQG